MVDAVRFPVETVEKAICEVLSLRGVPDADALATAQGLAAANLRGIDTHGLACLPDYVVCLDGGRINARADMRVEHRFPWAARLDADNGLGPAAATRAMRLALDAARDFGIGAVGVRRSNHFGAAGVYAAMAANEDCIGIVAANASPATAPYGSATAFLGTNPLAVAVPAGRHPPFVLDMATSEGSRKKVRKALAEGRPIPPGWALRADGQPTTDPADALEGVMLPFGGAKGSGVTLLVDILSAVLTGARFGGEVLSVLTNHERESGNGHFVLAMRVSAFLPEDEFKARMDDEISRLKALPPGAGFGEVCYPGERQWRTATDRRANGVPIEAALLARVRTLGARSL